MNEPDLVIGVLLAIAVIVWIIVRVNAQTTKKDSEERQKRNRDEAYRFFLDLEQQKTLPVTHVDVGRKRRRGRSI